MVQNFSRGFLIEFHVLWKVPAKKCEWSLWFHVQILNTARPESLQVAPLCQKLGVRPLRSHAILMFRKDEQSAEWKPCQKHLATGGAELVEPNLPQELFGVGLKTWKCETKKMEFFCQTLSCTTGSVAEFGGGQVPFFLWKKLPPPKHKLFFA